MSTVTIPLTKGKVAIVDAEDAALIGQWKWHIAAGGYAGRKPKPGRCSTQLMHRLIAAAPAGKHVDHINGDRLDNRRINLRIVTAHDNSWNRKKPMVDQQSGGWRARVCPSDLVITIGVFPDRAQAIEAYRAAAAMFGGFPVVTSKLTDETLTQIRSRLSERLESLSRSTAAHRKLLEAFS